MGSVRFSIAVRSGVRPRRVQVVVYDSIEEMQAAGERYSSMAPGEFRNALALSQPRTMWDENGVLAEMAGVLRFVRGHLDAEVVCHEATHMGFFIYRDDCQRGIGEGWGLNYMPQEEVLAHLVGEIASKVVSGLYRRRLYEGVG